MQCTRAQSLRSRGANSILRFIIYDLVRGPASVRFIRATLLLNVLKSHRASRKIMGEAMSGRGACRTHDTIFRRQRLLIIKRILFISFLPSPRSRHGTVISRFASSGVLCVDVWFLPPLERLLFCPCLSVCLFSVCVLIGLLKNCWSNLYEILWNGCT